MLTAHAQEDQLEVFPGPTDEELEPVDHDDEDLEIEYDEEEEDDFDDELDEDGD